MFLEKIFFGDTYVEFLNSEQESCNVFNNSIVIPVENCDSDNNVPFIANSGFSTIFKDGIEGFLRESKGGQYFFKNKNNLNEKLRNELSKIIVTRLLEVFSGKP